MCPTAPEFNATPPSSTISKLTNDKPQLCARCLLIMSDYEKSTVIKLRDELVARGLPKTGLKAALVQRLIEADAESEKANSAVNESSANSQEDESVTEAILPGPQALREPKDDDNATDDTPQSEEQDKNELKDADKAAEDAPHCEPDELMRRQPQTGEVQREEPFEQQRSDSLTQPSGYIVPKGAQSEALFEDPNESAEDPEPELQLPNPNQTQCAEEQAAEDKPAVSTQTSLTGDEFLQDSRKRKRYVHFGDNPSRLVLKLSCKTCLGSRMTFSTREISLAISLFPLKEQC